MYKYLCQFLYVGDTSKHSANIPDQVGFQCIIQSNNDELDSMPIARIKSYYEIQDYLEKNDCETIKIIRLEEDEIKEYSELEIIELNTKDLS